MALFRATLPAWTCSYSSESSIMTYRNGRQDEKDKNKIENKDKDKDNDPNKDKNKDKEPEATRDLLVFYPPWNGKAKTTTNMGLLIFLSLVLPLCCLSVSLSSHVFCDQALIKEDTRR